MLRFCLRSCLTLVLLSSSISQSYAEILSGTVSKVADGDTLTLSVSGSSSRVRLNQIDAPETAQAFGGNSASFLRSLVLGRNVQVDVSGTDSYGRLLGTVYIGSRNVNLYLVQQGYAWAYDRYVEDTAYFVAEDRARASNLGLWAQNDSDTLAPWIWRQQN